MAHLILLVLGALVVAALAYGVTWVVTGRDSGLDPEEPDGRNVPLPTDRPLFEADVTATRFDVTMRGYRMEQVDAAIRRMAYDIGYKDELITVLEAEVEALRENRTEDAEQLREARTGASPVGEVTPGEATPDDLAPGDATDDVTPADAEVIADAAGLPDDASAPTAPASGR